MSASLSWLHIEVKRVEHFNVAKACAQAARDAAGKPWIVAHRRNRKPWFITMDPVTRARFLLWVILFSKPWPPSCPRPLTVEPELFFEFLRRHVAAGDQPQQHSQSTLMKIKTNSGNFQPCPEFTGQAVCVDVRAGNEGGPPEAGCHTKGIMTMHTICFDIETGPLPEAELASMVPAFDPAEVKTGNLKDPDKVAAKIAEAEANHRREFIERAALDPLTGRVLAIGLLNWDTGEFRVIAHEDEAAMLREFWETCRGEMGRLNEMIGFNSRAFDLPFLIRRSFKHRVPVPFGIRRGRYWGTRWWICAKSGSSATARRAAASTPSPGISVSARRTATARPSRRCGNRIGRRLWPTSRTTSNSR